MIATGLVLLGLAQPLPGYVTEVEARWGSLVDVTITAADCGFDNAYYFPTDDTVVLCSDLFDRPDLTRAILNHELAHAFMDQRGIPQSEFGADELGFFFMSDEEVYSIAAWFLNSNSPPRKNDDHPQDLHRAAMFLCLDAGQTEDGPLQCQVYYQSAIEKWLALIAVTE